MKEIVKRWIKYSRLEPPTRWLVKRLRGIPIPYDNVRNEIYDRQAFEIIGLVLMPDSCCIDVGSHRGDYLARFLRHAPMGSHIGVEPIPELAAELRSRFAGTQIESVALSDSEGEATLYIAQSALALSGLREHRLAEAAGTFREVRVPVRQLDDIVPRDRRVDLIKIDVEGGEGPALMGALSTIRRNRPFVILEHGSRASEAFGYTSGQIYDLLRSECDLAVSLPRDWLRDRSPLTRSEFIACDEWYFVAHPPDRRAADYAKHGVT